MIRFGLALVAFAACLLTYVLFTSAERLLREVRQKLTCDRKPQVFRRQVQSFRIHDRLGRTSLEQDHAA